MANVAAELPDPCPRCGQAARWNDYNNPYSGYFFHTCTNTIVNGWCQWPVNHWTPESDDYATTETWMQTWKNIVGIS